MDCLGSGALARSCHHPYPPPPPINPSPKPTKPPNTGIHQCGRFPAGHHPAPRPPLLLHLFFRLHRRGGELRGCVCMYVDIYVCVPELMYGWVVLIAHTPPPLNPFKPRTNHHPQPWAPPSCG